MRFEFDPAKSKANKAKHGIDFEEAQQLWEDPFLVTAPARSESEPRFVLIAQLTEKVWCAFYTLRGGSIRIISVRRARTNEEEHYFEAQS